MVWETICGTNKAHTLAYSCIALQETALATNYPMIYWNCANLIADSGGLEGTVNYDKISAACARMQKEGITISSPDINKSDFDFTPDAETNSILFGLKAISGVGANEANIIISNRPYTSLEDFYNKMQALKQGENKITFGNTPIISLIKAGAFDSVENKSRVSIMKDFLKLISNPLKKLTISHIEDLNTLGLLTPDQKRIEYRYYRFKKYLFQKENIIEQGKSPATSWYKLPNERDIPFFEDNFMNQLVIDKDYRMEFDGSYSVKKSSLEKLIDKICEPFKLAVIDNPIYLDKINQSKLDKMWDEQTNSVIQGYRESCWEMETLNLYIKYPHELEGASPELHDLVSFDKLDPNPDPSSTWQSKDGVTFNKYETHQIIGTVISIDKSHGTVSLLTLSGLVTVRLGKDKLAFYNRDIVTIGPDGKKILIEGSWLKKGNLLMVTGYRMGENFNAKTYKDSLYQHSLQLITGMNDFGLLFTKREREEN